MKITAIGSLNLRERDEADHGDCGRRRIHAYLDLLEEQRRTPPSARDWGAFDELAELAAHFDLVLDVNAPDARTMPLAAAARAFGSLLREQQPTGGMSGQVNRTLVQQFRMPGYPMVLVTTDLLQEGEDLHTFCSDIHHYGISWTPSAMEQRIGRIDRVRSQTDRRLGTLERDPDGGELLQVFYPHLQDTVEVLQVQRVLDRMNTFLRLMHEGLAAPAGADRKIDVGRELVAGRRKVEAIAETLRSSFPVPEWALKGDVDQLAVEPSVPVRAKERFRALHELQPDGMPIDWVPDVVGTLLLGTGHLADRVQPFALHLRSDGSRLILRCISPVGRVDPQQATDAIVDSTTKRPVRIGAILTKDERSYDLTVENDVLLGAPEHDAARAAALLTRTLRQADELERIHLPEVDRKLDEFAADLAKDGGHGTT